MRVFHSFDTMDWGRVSIVVASIAAFWAGLISIVPEKYHHIGMVVLSSLTSALTLMMRSGRSRAEKIEEKAGEIKDLVINEVQEKTKP